MAMSKRKLFLAGGKGLGIFHCDGALYGSDAFVDSRELKIDTGVLSYDNATAVLLENQMLWVAGGKGLALFDVSML